MENIIAVQSEYNSLPTPTTTTTTDQMTNDSSVDETTINQPNVKQFTVVYAKRMENSSNPNKWRHFSQTFLSDDSQVCQFWIKTLQQQINGKNLIHSIP